MMELFEAIDENVGRFINYMGHAVFARF